MGCACTKPINDVLPSTREEMLDAIESLREILREPESPKKVVAVTAQ